MSPESQTAEYKSLWKDEYIRWIAGFANAQGGQLVVGKNNAGNVVGIDNASKLLVDIPNKVRDMLGILVDVNLHCDNGKDYLEIVVHPNLYPISYKGRYYSRSGSTLQELKGAALDQFLLRKQGKHWDGVPVPSVAVGELYQDAFERFRQLVRRSGRMEEMDLAESNAELLDKLKLIEGNYLKRAAVLLFHADPGKFVTGSYIKIGRFRTNTNLLYHDIVEGNLFTQVDSTLQLLLTKYLVAGIRYETLQRIEEFPIPRPALREAVLNAVVHKDYASAVPVQISVYDDKLMIWNPGSLPVGWDVERLLGKHSSQPYNPDIASVFFRSGEIEAWGRGIERIFESCREANAPEPAIHLEPGGIWLEFAFKPVLPVDTVGDESGLKVYSGGLKTEQGGLKVSKSSLKANEEEIKNLSERQQSIIEIIKSDNRVTQSEIAQKTGIHRSAVQKQLRALKDKGFLKRVGGARGHWVTLK